jgi:glycosyltransferase involved in cell wall biosynthesis
MIKQDKKFLSIIVPAYKQEKTIKKDLINIESVMVNGLSESYNHEIICVVDGNVDNTLKEALKAKSSNINVYGYERGFNFLFGFRNGYKSQKHDDAYGSYGLV